MQCQNCERPIEPFDERCPHCGAKPLHLRSARENRFREFELTIEESPFETGGGLPTNDWILSPEPQGNQNAAIDERSNIRDGAVRLGGFWRRACALIIDLIVIAALVSVMAFLSYLGYRVGLSAHGRSLSWENAAPLFVLLSWGGVGLATAYFVLFHGMEGMTIGKWLFGLKVVGSSQETITYRRAFWRWLAAAGFAPLALGFLWVLWSREKRAWHDYLAGTWVIRV